MDELSGRARAAITTALFLLLSIYAPAASAQAFAKGADVSWITQMEASGYRWQNDAGTQQDLLQILKDHGMNTIRLRVWVNPSGGWNGVNDVVAKAIRARNAGFRIMIDFHYSDSWADPGQQTKPAAWRTHTFEQLMADVYQHTFNTMNTLASNGIFPEWVQVGNETNNGMLWEDGRASVSPTNMRNYAWLVNSGYDAVKAVSANSKVIVHVSNAYDNALFRWNFDGLRANGARWDIIGMSLYPEPGNWQTQLSQAITNINDMRSRYGKGVMIVETGMSWDQATASKAFLTDLITRSRNAGALGVLYWEPQAFNWQGYTKGAWNTNGRPTIALDAFIEGTPQPQPGGSVTLQENLTGFCGVDGTIDSNHAGYTGSGFANSNNATNAGVRWRVNATAAGNFTLQWRFANGTTGNRPGSLRVNGTTLSTVALNATGAWTTWTNSASVTAALRAGANDIALVATTSGGLANVDSLTVTGSGISATACN